MQLNRAIIEAAIIGFERKKQEIEETLVELRAQLSGTSTPATTVRTANAPGAAKTKRVLSPAARKSIAAAQKARWAAFHANQGAPAKKTPAKRKMSPAAKAKLAANLAKARAAKAAKAKKSV
jgi:hypothetical protein